MQVDGADLAFVILIIDGSCSLAGRTQKRWKGKAKRKGLGVGDRSDGKAGGPAVVWPRPRFASVAGVPRAS